MFTDSQKHCHRMNRPKRQSTPGSCSDFADTMIELRNVVKGRDFGTYLCALDLLKTISGPEYNSEGNKARS